MWEGIPAAKNNRVIEINMKASSYSNPITLEYVLDIFKKGLLGLKSERASVRWRPLAGRRTIWRRHLDWCLLCGVSHAASEAQCLPPRRLSQLAPSPKPPAQDAANRAARRSNLACGHI